MWLAKDAKQQHVHLGQIKCSEGVFRRECTDKDALSELYVSLYFK